MNGFFQDSKGNRSMGRLLAFPVVITGLVLCCFGSISFFINKDFPSAAVMGTGITLVTLGLGAKALQNNTERRNGEIK